MNLRTLIIDDEKPSRDALSNYLHDYCPNVEILTACNSIKTAHKAILKYDPQLIFLDIEMPNGNGFDLLRMCHPINFKIIFITAYSEYAIQAFRFSAADYLLKPVKVDELVESVNKVRQDIHLATGNQNIQKLLENAAMSNFQLSQLVIPDCNGFKVINTEELILCEADGYCTHFHLAGKDKITSSKNLKHYEELLLGQGFLRVHNSYLLNLAHVESYSNQGEINLTGKIKCPLGNAYKPLFLARFRRLK